MLVACALAALLVTPPAAHASPDTWGESVRLKVQTADVDGVRTTYAILGPASAAPLVLMNGTGSPMAQWDPALLAGLSRDQRVLVYDYPGLGGSAALPGRLTFDALADHAAGLMDAVGLARAHVLGWSMGGFVAQRLAVGHPARVSALILAATNPGGAATTLGPGWVQEQDSDPESTLRGYVRTNYPPGHRDRGWAFVRRVDAAISSGRYPADRVPATVYDAMVAAEDPWLDSSANLRALRNLEVPTLVVTGREDVVTPLANSRLLARTIPGARLLLVPESGHSFLFQQPAGSAAIVTRFLRAMLDAP